MATTPINTSSTGSGIDVNTIVSQLMQVESQPLQKLKQKEADYQAKISAYATLLNSVTSLRDSVSLLKNISLDMKASVSDSTYFTATASNSAITGTYNVNVKQIAKAQSLVSTTFTSTTASVADLSVNPVQKLKIQVGSGTAAEITIDSTNNTLTGIRDAINNAHTGLAAAIVQDGTNYRLTVSSNTTGQANTIKIFTDEDNNGTFEEAADQDALGLSRLASNGTFDVNNNLTAGYSQMSQTQNAQDAVIKVNGLELSRSSNTISDIISGVTLSLTKGDPNYSTNPSNITVTVSQDYSSFASKLSSMVTAYNGTMSAINGLQGNNNKLGVLSGDSTLQGLKNSLRYVTTTKFSNDIFNNTLTFLGITHDKNGVLSLDSSKLESAINSDPSKVESMINSMASSFKTNLDNYTNTLIPARQDGYKSTVKNIQKDEDNLTQRLTLTEAALKKKFIALDTLLNQLQNTSSYLTTQMSQLSKTFGGSNG